MTRMTYTLAIGLTPWPCPFRPDPLIIAPQLLSLAYLVKENLRGR